MAEKTFIHPTADVDKRARIGEGTKVWHQAQVREDVQIGKNCKICKGVYIDRGVEIGNNVKVENLALVYSGVRIEDGVIVGPLACLTNDKIPRATTLAGRLKTQDEWEIGKILVKEGSSIGAGSIVLPDVIVGKYAMVGAGSVVTKDVPDYGLVYGNPAELKGFVCKEGERIEVIGKEKEFVIMRCPKCKEEVKIPVDVYNKIKQR